MHEVTKSRTNLTRRDSNLLPAHPFSSGFVIPTAAMEKWHTARVIKTSEKNISICSLRNSQAKLKSAGYIISREVKTQEIGQYLSVCATK